MADSAAPEVGPELALEVARAVGFLKEPFIEDDYLVDDAGDVYWPETWDFAGLVIEAMRERGWWLRIDGGQGISYRVYFFKPTISGSHCTSLSFPEAVAHAALAAVEG